MGMWHSGSASALHAESPGFDSPHLHRIRVRAVQGARLKFECVRTRGFKSHRMQAIFEWSRVRLTLGAILALIAQW
eukprot:scaffold6789_cov206-Skeletonema_marinoi.AAC.19